MNKTITYPHPKPKPSLQLYALAVLAAFGLAALWLAAFDAFTKIAPAPQAFFAATLIEAGLIAEAMALVRYKDSWYPKLGLVVSIIVSGTYNFIQADIANTLRIEASQPALAMWPLLALALGPLLALAFLALALGDTLQRHQAAADQWATDRANWLADRAAKAEERQRQQELWQRQREQEEAEHRRKVEEDQRQYERKEAERKRKRAERAARQRQPIPARTAQNGTLAATNGTSGTTNGTDSANLPAGLSIIPTDRDHFRQLVRQGAVDPEKLTGSILAQHAPVSERAARGWLKEAKQLVPANGHSNGHNGNNGKDN